MASRIVKIINAKDRQELYALKINDEVFLSLFGELLRSRHIAEVKNTKNVPNEVKNKFAEMEKCYKKQLKCEKKAEEIAVEIKNLQKERLLIGEELKQTLGILSLNDFERVFSENVPKEISNDMIRFNFKVDSPCGIGYKATDLHISRMVIIDKYYGEGILTYREYDGCIFMADDCEKYPEYKKYIKDHSRKLSIKKKYPFTETLFVSGEALCYSSCYEIPLGNKPLTKEYAVKLAKSLTK